MTITGHYHFETDLTEFTFDEEAKGIISRSAALVADFCADNQVSQILAAFPGNVLSRFTSGAAALKQFVEARAPSLNLQTEDARCAVHVTLFALLFRLDNGQPIAPLPLCVLLLARVVPFTLSRHTLPPPEHVLDITIIGSETWKSYEAIRQCRKGYLPQLPLHALYELGQALHEGGSEEPGLQPLMADLESVTRTFRSVMTQAALKEIASDATNN